jgi:hypothetical protein
MHNVKTRVILNLICGIEVNILGMKGTYANNEGASDGRVRVSVIEMMKTGTE